MSTVPSTTIDRTTVRVMTSDLLTEAAMLWVRDDGARVLVLRDGLVSDEDAAFLDKLLSVPDLPEDDGPR